MQQKPKLLEQVRVVARARYLRHRAEDIYHNFIKRNILFHDKKHPQEMSVNEIREYLTHLAVEKNVAASTQNQAFFALLFLYRDVLRINLPNIEGVEAKAILAKLTGFPLLVASLLYGSGLRLTEALHLCVKDIDFRMRLKTNYLLKVRLTLKI